MTEESDRPVALVTGATGGWAVVRFVVDAPPDTPLTDVVVRPRNELLQRKAS